MGGIPLQSGPYQSSIGMGGAAYAYVDTGGSTACVASSSLCGKGIAVAANGQYSTRWGGGIGINLDEAMGSPTVNTIAVTSAGLSYSLSNLPPGARISVANCPTPIPAGGCAQTSWYCANLTATSGTIPWTTFDNQCWSPGTGTKLTGPPQSLSSIDFNVPSAASTDTPWDFCVTSLSL
jgi:hypothetical protein